RSSSYSLPAPPRSTLFPYTTLFRSAARERQGHADDVRLVAAQQLLGQLGQEHRGQRPARRRRQQRLEGRLALRQALTVAREAEVDRKSTRLNSSHVKISYAVFCLKK